MTVSAIIIVSVVAVAVVVVVLLNYPGVYVEDVGNWSKDMMITYG